MSPGYMAFFFPFDTVSSLPLLLWQRVLLSESSLFKTHEPRSRGRATAASDSQQRRLLMWPHQCTQYTNVDTCRKKSAVWHFQLITWYQVSFVYTRSGFGVFKELSEAVVDCHGRLLHRPRDCEWYLSFLPVILISALSLYLQSQPVV